MNQPTVFVFEPSDSAFNDVAESLARRGFDLVRMSEKKALMRSLDARPADVVVLVPSAVGLDNNLDLARQVREFSGAVPLVLVVPRNSEDLAIAVLHAGINEYLKYPCAPEDLVHAVRRCLQLPENGQQAQAVGPPVDGIIGTSP